MKIILLCLLVTSVIVSGVLLHTKNNKATLEPQVVELKTDENIEAVIEEPINKNVEEEFENIIYDSKSMLVTLFEKEGLNRFSISTFSKPKVQNNIISDNEEVQTTRAAIIKETESDKRIESFLSLTNTTKEQYDSINVSMYPNDGHIIAVVRPVRGMEVAVEKAIREFIIDKAGKTTDREIRNLFENYEMASHNGHYIIVVSVDSERIIGSIIENMVAIDNIIIRAIKQ